jgi:hypothetical protein
MREPKCLSMSPDEYSEGLKRCKAKAEEKLEALSASKKSGEDDEESKMDEHLLASSRIPPIEICRARLRGEVIDIQWALHWREKNGYSESSLLAASREMDKQQESADRAAPGIEESYLLAFTMKVVIVFSFYGILTTGTDSSIVCT